MGGNVGGNNNISIKLNNGQTVSLKKLDKLVGQSTIGTIWDSYAGDDHILQQNEVEKIKQKFQKAMTDGTVNQEELNEIFDNQRATDTEGNKKDFSGNTLLNTLNSIPDEEAPVVVQEPPVQDEVPKSTSDITGSNQQADLNHTETESTVVSPDEKERTKTTTNYKIQPGDTPEKLADKLGLEGEEAQEFIQHMRQQMKGRKWFNVGESVTLLGNQEEKIEQMRSQGTYTEDTNELKTRFDQTEHGQKVRAQAEARRSTSVPAQSPKPQAPQYPQSIQNILKSAKAEKGDCKITKNDDGSYNLWITGTNYAKKHGCASYVLKYDAKGNRISQTNNYANGKVLEGIKGADGKYTWKEKTPLKGDALKMFNTVQNDWHGQAQVQYTKDGYNIIATGTDYEKKNGISKYTYQYDRNGKLLSKTRVYNDGKEQKSVPKNGKDNWVTTKEAKKEEKGLLDRATDWISETWDDLTSSKPEPAKKTAPKATTTKSTPATQKKTATTSAKPKTTQKPREMTFYEKSMKYLSTQEKGYPKGIQEKLIEYREQGVGATVEKTRSGYRLTLDEDNIDYKNIDYFANNSLQKRQEIMNRQSSRMFPMNRDQKTFDFDKDGNIIKLTQDYQHKTVTTPYYKGKPVDASAPAPLARQNTQYKKVVQYSKVDASRVSNDKVPADLKIELPDRWKDNEDVQEFAQSLIQNKSALMKELGLTNAQYDNLVGIALGVAENETHYGSIIYEDTKGETHAQGRILKKKAGQAAGLLSGENHSYGVAQINYWATAMGKDPNDPSVKALRQQLSKFGINGHKDYENNPAKAAVAELIILNNKRKTAESPEWQDLIARLNERIPNEQDKITTDDITATLYNGAGYVKARMKETLTHPAGTPDGSKFSKGIRTNNTPDRVDKNGDQIKDGMSYARNVRAYRGTFKISSSTNSKNRSAALSADSQSNYGELGIVHFMPSAYSNSKSRVGDPNVAAATLTKSLQGNNKIPQDIKNRLIQAVKNNEIGFGGQGFLTEKEANSITLDDAKLMLKKLDTLKSQMKAQGIDPTTDKAQVRELAEKVDASFHSDYMQSRQVVANSFDIKNKSSILPGFASSDVVNERLVAKRKTIIEGHERAYRNSHAGGYQKNLNVYDGMRANGQKYGFGVERSLGIDPYFADGTMISPMERALAETAEDIASVDMATSNQCATAIKASWESAGVIASRSDVKYPKNMTQKMPAGMTVDNFVKKAGLPDVKSQQEYKQRLLNRLNKNAKVDVNGNLIAGKTLNARASITIQQGDTLDTILKRCGYTQDTDANKKEYARKREELKKQLQTDGMLDANGNPMPAKTTTHTQLIPSANGPATRVSSETSTPNTFSFSAKVKIQENDSYEKMASRLGYTGRDAARCAANLKHDAEATQVFNPDGTFKEGANVIIHAAGEPIGIAGHLYLYMDAHPEKFERLTYVNNGDGTVRELNASDAKRMPAAVTAVFTPGEGFEDQCGHAAITNGNGQGYADEVDNMRWADFATGGHGNGKGEHGRVRYYRLSAQLRAR